MTTTLPIINRQPIEKQDGGDGSTMDVVNVWYTIQGEGPFAGTPAVFVRLAGCNLQCQACDTDYTTKRTRVPVDTLVHQIVDAFPFPKVGRLVVITGGEPFRQRCGPFVGRLLEQNLLVQFETNGTLYDDSMSPYWDKVVVVCSPKTGGLVKTLQYRIHALKYIVEAGKVDPADGLPTDSLLTGVRPARPWDAFRGARSRIYVQPLDCQDFNKNQANQQAAVESCMKYGYTLCLQQHKLLGLP